MVPSAAHVPSSFWGVGRRQALAELQPQIAHWEARLCDWSQVPDVEATWFVDPPYQGALGKHYHEPSARLDFGALAAACQSWRGQVIVCEGPEATWLPFRPHHEHASAPTADVKGRRVSREMIWTNDEAGQ